MSEKWRRGLKVIWQNLKSSFQLLIYMNKLVPFLKSSKKKQNLSSSPEISTNTNESQEQDKPVDSSPRKRGRPKKKTPEDIKDLQPQESSIEEISLPEEQIEISPFAFSQNDKSKRLLKPFIFSVGVLFLGIGFFYGYKTVRDKALVHPLKAPASSSLKEKQGNTPILDEQKRTSQWSMQPQLNLQTTKGIIRTINPHFLRERTNSTSKQESQNIISIVLYDVGVKEDETDKILQEIPEEVTIAVSPYAKDIDSLTQDLNTLGYTVLLQMPWERDDPYVDTGNLTLSAKQNYSSLLQNLTILQERSKNTSGFFVARGETLMRHPPNLSAILQFIARNQKTLIAPPDVLLSQLHVIAAQSHLDYACITLVDPKDEDFQAIDRLAKRSGFAILAFPLKKNSGNLINSWIKKIERAKLTLVPTSKIFDSRE